MSDATQIERAVVGIVLVDPDRAIVTAIDRGVKADWFADDTCHVAWLAIEKLWANGQVNEADALSIFKVWTQIAASSEIKKKNLSPRVDFGAVDALIDAAPPLAHLEHHCGLLRDCHIERLTRNACQKCASAFKSGDATSAVNSLIADLQKILNENTAASGRRVNLESVCNELMAEYKESYQKRIVEKNLTWTSGYKFPWSPMTAIMNGLQPGFGIIAARPSVGKTLFALNLIRYWSDTGVKVVFNSLDMEQHSLIRRFIAERARVSIRKAMFSPTSTDIEVMEKACAKIAKLPLCMVEMRDVDEFCNYCTVEHSAGRCQIVVVDYLGLLHSTKVDNSNEYARVSYVSDRLKSLANRLRIPIIALCQLNRDVAKDSANRMPGLSDLRGSGSIEQDAFWVLFLHRDDRTVNQEWKEHPPTQLMPPGTTQTSFNALDSVLAILCKSQNGATANLPFVFRKHYLACSLGDWRALPVRKQVGYGSTAHDVLDYSPQFAKVCSDWRHDPLEEVLRQQGALIELPDCVEGD